MQLFSWLDLSHLGHFHYRSTCAAANLSSPSPPFPFLLLLSPLLSRHPPSIDLRNHCSVSHVFFRYFFPFFCHCQRMPLAIRYSTFR
ncbi:hypothetical protein Mapa_014912 [Marchantia paleacea]|nr:hypothetical protein Mapa_014912 [Marchantia paleacea]